jgi:hypothetical protein
MLSRVSIARPRSSSADSELIGGIPHRYRLSGHELSRGRSKTLKTPETPRSLPASNGVDLLGYGCMGSKADVQEG